MADGFTLEIGNQMNGWKKHKYFPRGRSLVRRYCCIRCHGGEGTYLLAYWVDGLWCDVTDQDTRTSVKATGLTLEHPTEYGIDIGRLDTHFLRSRGANQLATAGYSEIQIQKMGRWKDYTFKEYIIQK